MGRGRGCSRALLSSCHLLVSGMPKLTYIQTFEGYSGKTGKKQKTFPPNTEISPNLR
jgi:hypothetical protein